MLPDCGAELSPKSIVYAVPLACVDIPQTTSD